MSFKKQYHTAKLLLVDGSEIVEKVNTVSELVTLLVMNEASIKTVHLEPTYKKLSHDNGNSGVTSMSLNTSH